MQIRAVIETLNSLSLGELSSLQRRVEEVQVVCRENGLDEIAEILQQSIESMRAGDLKGFRKRIQHAVSRLGHVKQVPAPR